MGWCGGRDRVAARGVAATRSRSGDAELLESILYGIGDEQDVAILLLEDALGDAMIEEGKHGVIKARGVEQEDGLGVDLEGLPGQYLEEFFKGAEAAGQDDEGVGALSHERLARVHGVGDVELGETVVGDLEIDEDLGDDTDDVTTAGDGGFGYGLHEADLGAAVDEADLMYGESTAQGFGLFTIDGARAIG